MYSKQESVQMINAREYIAQILDICVAELSYQATGDQNKLNQRQYEFLYKIVNRYRSVNEIGLSRYVGQNAYTIGKKDIYFRPTTIENINQFVLLHELSHIGTDSVGETQEFWENFKYMIQVADTYDAYMPINYEQINYAFHTMNIDSNPLFINEIKDIAQHMNNGDNIPGADIYSISRKKNNSAAISPPEHFMNNNNNNIKSNKNKFINHSRLNNLPDIDFNARQ